MDSADKTLKRGDVYWHKNQKALVVIYACSCIYDSGYVEFNKVGTNPGIDGYYLQPYNEFIKSTIPEKTYNSPLWQALNGA